MMVSTLKRWSLLISILIGLSLFFIFDFSDYLTFASLKQHRQTLLFWTETHYLLAVLTYIAVYSVAVAVSVPGAVFLTLAGGFLFGIVFGTVYVVISATLGATFLFIAIRMALEPWIRKSTSRWVEVMREGFKQNAFQYLLTLRLIPLFPFWIVNIVPAVLGVNLRTFVIATFIGIIPGSFIYVTIGNGLGHLFDQDKTPDLAIVFEPTILLPLIGLGLLSLSPILYKWIRRKPS